MSKETNGNFQDSKDRQTLRKLYCKINSLAAFDSDDLPLYISMFPFHDSFNSVITIKKNYITELPGGSAIILLFGKNGNSYTSD